MVIKGRRQGNLDYDVRLLEAETAYDLGIEFGNKWYDIPVIAREHMIATRLARQWMETLASEEAVKESQRGRSR